MPVSPAITREIAPLPGRREDVHKGDVGRIVVIGGCCDDDVAMIGAPALTASAAFRCGAGLIQVIVPREIRTAVAMLVPCATFRTLPTSATARQLLDAVTAFRADTVVIGPGLGTSIAPDALRGFVLGLTVPVVIDADGLNVLAGAERFDFPDPQSVVLTPHLGELRRLLAGRGLKEVVETTPEARREAACTLVQQYKSVAVLKGCGTIVTDGQRLYVNETGNAGMATAGTGDVLSGVIAAFIGQQMTAIEASILGVFLHGLAGDFAAEELGRRSVTALDVIDTLHEAICDYESTASE